MTQQRKAKTTTKRKSEGAKVTLGDTPGMKHALDTALVEAFSEAGFDEDHLFSNFRLVLSFLAIAAALLAQFYPGPLQDNWCLNMGCVVCYSAISVALSLFNYFIQKDIILVTKPSKECPVPLRISTTLPRFSETYTISLSAVDPSQHPEISPVEVKNSVGRYFYADGTLADVTFFQDVSHMLQSISAKKRH